MSDDRTIGHTPDQQTAITADLNERNTGTAYGTYRPGDHLRDERDDDPAREWDEWECPMPRHPELTPLEDMVIACPHGKPDDRDCRKCMDTLAGTAAPVIAATKARKDAA